MGSPLPLKPRQDSNPTQALDWMDSFDWLIFLVRVRWISNIIESCSGVLADFWIHSCAKRAWVIAEWMNHLDEKECSPIDHPSTSSVRSNSFCLIFWQLQLIHQIEYGMYSVRNTKEMTGYKEDYHNHSKKKLQLSTSHWNLSVTCAPASLDVSLLWFVENWFAYVMTNRHIIIIHSCLQTNESKRQKISCIRTFKSIDTFTVRTVCTHCTS